MSTKNQIARSQRVASLDRMKGLCVLLMLIITAAGYFPWMGLLYRLGDDQICPMKNVNVGDFCTPFFQFMIGMSFVLSFRRHRERDGKKAYLHFVRRYVTFVGLGSAVFVSAPDLLQGKKDPFLFMSVLTCTLAVLAVCWAVLSLTKAGKTCRRRLAGAIGVILLALGVWDILLGIWDAVYIFTSADDLTTRYNNAIMHWSILHVIGVAGLWGLCYVGLSLRGKLTAWFALVLGYAGLQLLPGVMETFGILVLGGFAGTVGWSVVVLSGMIYMELYLRRDRLHWRYLAFFLVNLALAIPACLWLPSNARAVTVNFILVSDLVFAGLFLILTLFDGWEPRYQLLTAYGRNPLMMLMVGGVMKVALEGGKAFFASASPWVGGAFLCLCFATLSLLASGLNRRNKLIRL